MLRTILLPLFFISCFSMITYGQDNNPNLGIIPVPVSIKKSTGEFVLSQQTVLLADTVTNKAVVFLTDYLQNKAMLRVQLKANDGSATANSIVLTAMGTDNLPVDGYRLTITPQQIII